MTPYRKIDTRIWNDAKFVRLSDDGQLVFLYILTHPNLTMIGAMRASIEGLAAEKKWEYVRFRDAFQESLDCEFIEFDQESGLLSIPHFLRYNPPNSPNVVRSWAKVFDLLPECTARDAHVENARQFTEDLGEAFAKAFAKALRQGMREALPKGSRKPLGKACPNKKQNIEKESINPPTPLRGNSFWPIVCNSLKTDALKTERFEAAWADWEEHRRTIRKKLTKGAVQRQAKRLEAMGHDRAVAAIDYTIEQGWTGIFEPNGRPGRKPEKRTLSLLETDDAE